jgi:hypothetical protein
MMRFLQEWVDRFKPNSVNVFWDAKKKSVWRKDIYHDYKERDSADFRIDIREDLVYTQSAAKALFKHMGVRQFHKKNQEADDLIYSACLTLAPSPVLVISTDKDLHQLPFRMQHVTLYEPMKNHIVEKPEFDPVIQKALAGDKSDTIDGYFKVGPVNGRKMALDRKLLFDFLEEKGRTIFLRNMLLMDLSLNPHLLANNFYCSKKLCEQPKFDKKSIIEESKRHKVTGLVSDFSRTVAPMKIIQDQQLAKAVT